MLVDEYNLSRLGEEKSMKKIDYTCPHCKFHLDNDDNTKNRIMAEY